MIAKTVIAVRSATKGVDRDARSAFASGERNIAKEYDDALDQDDIHSATVDLLARQKAELLMKIAEIEAMGRGE